MRSLLAVLVAAAALAGCLGGASTLEVEPKALNATSASGPALNATNLTVAAAPAWSVGDAWTFATTQGGKDGQPFTAVVTTADSGGYTLQTTSPDLATFDALYDISYVGHVRASDLAGAQQGKPIAFFSFPLSDGKTWSTTWDGLSIALTARARGDIPTPDGPKPGFDIVGMAGDKPYVSYDFVPALRWWSHLDFGANYTMRVTGAQANWTGTVYTATAKPLLALGPAAPVAETPEGDFTVDKGQTTLYVTMGATYAAYARTVVLVDPNNQPHQLVTDSAAQAGGSRVQLTLDPTPGAWRALAPTVHDPGATFSLAVQEVAVKPVVVA